jgi:uroporphyrinogen decarboxylase
MSSNEYMSPRERVVKSLNREIPDRIPLDIKAEKEIFYDLQKHFNKSDNDEVMDALGIDFRRIHPNYVGSPIKTFDDGSFIDMWGAHRKFFNYGAGTYFEYAGHPLAEIKKQSELETFSWPQPDEWDVGGIPDQIKKTNENKDYCLIHECGGIFELAWGLRGMELFFMDMATQPEIPWEIMSRLADHFIELTRRVLETADGQIDIVYTFDDLGTQMGPLVSPKMWEEQIKPHHVRLNKVIKEHGARVMYHSCGSIIQFIDGFIDMGVDILNPLQPRPKGMDLKRIKETYGDRLCFHGAMDIQKTLPYGTEEEVRAEVGDRIKTLGKDGGYILAPAHSIQPDTPVDNIVTMYDAARNTHLSP